MVCEVNDKHNFFCSFFFLSDSPNCQWNPGGGGDVAAPVNRTKGPIVARDHYPLKLLYCRGLRHGNEISERNGNLIASFVLTEHRSDLSGLLLQIWQWLLISSHYCACSSWHMFARVNLESTMHWHGRSAHLISGRYLYFK